MQRPQNECGSKSAPIRHSLHNQPRLSVRTGRYVLGGENLLGYKPTVLYILAVTKQNGGQVNCDHIGLLYKLYIIRNRIQRLRLYVTIQLHSLRDCMS